MQHVIVYRMSIVTRSNAKRVSVLCTTNVVLLVRTVAIALRNSTSCCSELAEGAAAASSHL
jgi:hypothetical protein